MPFPAKKRILILLAAGDFIIIFSNSQEIFCAFKICDTTAEI